MDYESEGSLLRDGVRILVQVITVITFAWFLVYSFGSPRTASGQRFFGEQNLSLYLRPILQRSHRTCSNGKYGCRHSRTA